MYRVIWRFSLYRARATGKFGQLTHHAVRELAIFVGRPGGREPTRDWRTLAAMYDIVGRLDAASAAVVAVDLDVSILTTQPGRYGGLAGGGPVIPI